MKRIGSMGGVGLLLGLVMACGGDYPAPTASGDPVDGSGSGGGTDGDQPPPVEPTDAEWWERYQKVREQAKNMGVDVFLDTYPEPPYLDQLGYAPDLAVGADAIQQVYPFTAAQQDAFDANGFVALDGAASYTFETTYHDLYFADLPVLITTDSVLYALHRSFDSILQSLETSALAQEVTLLLEELHEGLDPGQLPAELSDATLDVDIYLTVARSLMDGEQLPARSGAAADDEVTRILDGVESRSVIPVNFFGVSSDYDFSQFEPRGHYEDDPLLRRYFQAMMWLGRTDVPMVTFPEGEAVNNRRGLEAAFLLDQLLRDTGAIDRWERVDRVLMTLIGEPDSMDATDMAAFREDAALGDLGDLVAASDDQIFDALTAKSYGLQRIMSQVMFTDPNDPLVKLPRVFHVLGQRFTLDSYVYNNVTYDRVQDLTSGTKVTRMLPDELDVQFALGSNRAAHLLEPQLQEYRYQGTLHELRFIFDTHPSEFWSESFYSGWLEGLRALNPGQSERARYPEPMRTRAWDHKTLNTQAASRAELRHDTLLYAKQSYSGGIGCEYPDAYVEPAETFYGVMAQLGELGATMIADVADVGYATEGAAEYFANWTTVMRTLQSIAARELAGEPMTGDDLAFLGQTIEKEIIGCGEEFYDGWYPSLFFDRDDVASPRPTIADVHTAPTDAFGDPVGWVQHTATGTPMLMVLTVEGCDGGPARAYAGPISSHYDVLTTGFERLTDSAWAQDLNDGAPPRPEWTHDFAP